MLQARCLLASRGLTEPSDQAILGALAEIRHRMRTERFLELLTRAFFPHKK